MAPVVSSRLSWRTLVPLVAFLFLVSGVFEAPPALAKGGGKAGGAKGKSANPAPGKGKKGGGKPNKGKSGKGKKGKGKKGKGKGKGKGGSSAGGGGGGPSTGQVVRADVLNWILANNPGLSQNFLATELPDKVIKLPNGKTTPIYKTKQFLDVNFRLTFFARKKEKGSDVVPEMEMRCRKLMATPQFYERVMHHRDKYKISPMGMVSAKEAYNHFRNINRHLGVTANKKLKAPVGGGSGINAPSWAVWKAMNIFFHEACHCIGIGHDSGGLSGPIAGSMRDWDRKKLWNYKTIDLNHL